MTPPLEWALQINDEATLAHNLNAIDHSLPGRVLTNTSGYERHATGCASLGYIGGVPSGPDSHFQHRQAAVCDLIKVTNLPGTAHATFYFLTLVFYYLIVAVLLFGSV